MTEKVNPELAEAHMALNAAIKRMEELSGAKIAAVIVMENGQTVIEAVFDNEADIDSFMQYAQKDPRH